MTEAPLTRNYLQQVPAVATAGNDATTDVVEAEWAGTVTSVQYIATAAITGANTNTRSLSLVNKGTGAGATVVATIQFNSGTNATANAPLTVPLSGTAANLAVNANDVLQWQSTHVGTGITDPGGEAVVQLTRSATA